MKKILITYATAGTGHTKAALAIKKAFDELAPKDIEVAMIDALDYTNAFFKWAYLKIYLLLVNRLPLLWGLSYYLTDIFFFNFVVSPFRVLSNWLNSRRLANYLMKSKPDFIISTHFFPSEVVSYLKKRGLLSSCLITVVTDYRLHMWWLLDETDIYVVGSREAHDDLLKKNIDSPMIKIIGIPVEPIFSKKLNRIDVLQRTNLKDDPFTILVIGGGFGVGPIKGIVKVINGVSKDRIQVITICGHNKRLVERIESLKARLKIDIKVLGYVNNVYDYMEVSDILISKSGGITITESLVKELPMIIISPIPGQETRNAEFLTKKSAALKIDNLSGLEGVLGDLISHPEKLAEMRTSIRRIRKPEACYEIARAVIELCRQDAKEMRWT